MAERIVRLYGPASVSTDLGSPTTLFTVPERQLYIVRFASSVVTPVTGAADSSSVLIGKTNLTQANLILGLDSSSGDGAYRTAIERTAIPFTEGEVAVAAKAAALDILRFDYNTSTSNAWQAATTTDASSFLSNSFTPQTINTPTNVFFLTVNTKAASPDAITSIVDSHTNPVSSISSIVTVASAGVRASIWEGNAFTQPGTTTTYTTTFGGTQTAFWSKAVAFQNSILSIGTPTASLSVLQTATSTGTTEVSQGVTMTPQATDSFQILVVGRTGGVGGSYSFDDANGTELGDTVLTTPDSAAAAYFIYPSVANPSATTTVAGTNWAAVCIEVAKGGSDSNLTLSGLILE